MSEQDDARTSSSKVPRHVGFPAVPGLRALRVVIGTGRRRLAVTAAACALLVTARHAGHVPAPDRGPADQPGTGPAGHRGSPRCPSARRCPAFLRSFPRPGLAGRRVLLDAADQPRHAQRGQRPPLTRSGKPRGLLRRHRGTARSLRDGELAADRRRSAGSARSTGLAISRAPQFEHPAPVDSWTFYGSHYSSPYLSFVPVERYSNVLVNAKANPNASKSYRALQQLTPPSCSRPSSPSTTSSGSTPFLDFGNRAVQIGSGFHLSAADGRSRVVAPTRRRPPAAEDRPRRRPARRGGLAQCQTLPPHRRPPRFRLPGIPPERRAPLLKVRCPEPSGQSSIRMKVWKGELF